MKKFYKKLLATVLSFALILSSVPLITFAQTHIKSETDFSEEASITSNEKAKPIAEIQEKRTSNSKTFLMSDGTYMNAVYSEQIHYSDNGEWKDIDNSFSNVTEDNGENIIEN